VTDVVVGSDNVYPLEDTCLHASITYITSKPKRSRWSFQV